MSQTPSSQDVSSTTTSFEESGHFFTQKPYADDASDPSFGPAVTS